MEQKLFKFEYFVVHKYAMFPATAPKTIVFDPGNYMMLLPPNTEHLRL